MVTGWGGEGRGGRIGMRLHVETMELTKKLERDRREGLEEEGKEKQEGGRWGYGRSCIPRERTRCLVGRKLPERV